MAPPLARRRRLAPVLLAALALSLLAPPAVTAAGGAGQAGQESGQGGAAKPAKVAISRLAVNGRRVTVEGRVTLSSNTAVQRKRTRVVLTLSSGGSGDAERFKAASIDAKRRFKVSKKTRLTGRLAVAALVKIAGRQSGKQARRLFQGPQRSPSTSSPPSPLPPIEGPLLIGTFKLDEGVRHPDGSHTGTYFRMIDPGGEYLINDSSRSPDKTYTLLRPGTDGGLRTDAYQPRSNPLFDATGVLSRRIVERELFFGIYFTIFTEPKDFEAPFVAIPPPQIAHQDGKLTGQVSAWVANWNQTNLFNQGTPKPNGTLPGSTVPLTGTYDPATRRFTLEWTSLIVGGPFGGFGGYWHLEGAFAPAA